ncbi:HAD-IA family hydrolase [Inquilinus limosus]|uniref:HAD-IA family hydrolase n=1 Tax=Inquilinus limosus TaxID=171674 RepID=UPI00042A13F9|nr:HAD-IA family hydrolase [Inquilinus limosus]
MRLEAILFDVDGTLAETEEVHRQSFNAAFRAAGLDWHWSREQYRELLAVTGGKERIGRFLAGMPDPPRCDVAALHRAKTERYTALVAAGAVALRPGVARLLAEARAQGVRLAIATTTTPANVAALLAAALGPKGPALFEVMVAGDAVPSKKPAPDVYLAALEAMGLDPAGCVAIEDSRNGVLAARRAGLPVLATPSLYTGDEDLRHALAVLSDLGEPDAPYRHLGGAGAGEGWVTVEALGRWAADFNKQRVCRRREPPHPPVAFGAGPLPLPEERDLGAALSSPLLGERSKSRSDFG